MESRLSLVRLDQLQLRRPIYRDSIALNSALNPGTRLYLTDLVHAVKARVITNWKPGNMPGFHCRVRPLLAVSGSQNLEIPTVLTSALPPEAAIKPIRSRGAADDP